MGETIHRSEDDYELLTTVIELGIYLDQLPFGQIDALGLTEVATAISRVRDNIE